VISVFDARIVSGFFRMTLAPAASCFMPVCYSGFTSAGLGVTGCAGFAAGAGWFRSNFAPLNRATMSCAFASVSTVTEFPLFNRTV